MILRPVVNIPLSHSSKPDKQNGPSMPRAQNTVIILSDEHNRNISGCYDHPFIRTPNIDQLAARGTRFTSAYCNSPICVPSRASLATGQYVHRIRCWDNAIPFHGQHPSWHSVIRDAGSIVTSIGKLHFRSAQDDNGFSEEILPMHILDGKGDLKGLLRQNPPPKVGADEMAKTAGTGHSDYFAFDRKVAQAAVSWIAQAAKNQTKPWVLFVSFVMPHFPLIVPEEYYALYADLNLDQLQQGLNQPPSDHPVIQQLRSSFDYDTHFDDEKRAVALRAYFGMITALDENIGNVLSALQSTGIEDKTRVIYTSDHGDNLGNRGMWGKCVHYDDSVAVPMIAVGDGFPVKVENTPVSLVDIYPTLLDSSGTLQPENNPSLDGTSLFEIVSSPDKERSAFSEYHAVYSRAGHFMLRKGDWKLNYYVDGPPQLFNLKSDPEERIDLANNSDHSTKRDELVAALHEIVDPAEVSANALSDQRAAIDTNGGVHAVLNSIEIPHTPVPSS